MIIAVAALLVLGVLFFTLRVKEKHLRPAEGESPLQPLEEAKARIYENLRDLQFEYRLGKITDTDYQPTVATVGMPRRLVLSLTTEF